MRKRINAESTKAESARALAEGPQSFLATSAVLEPPSATSVPGTPSDGEPAPSSWTKNPPGALDRPDADVAVARGSAAIAAASSQ